MRPLHWETRYLVYAGSAALPSALYATLCAHLPATLLAVPSLPLPLSRRGSHGQATAERRTA